MRCVQALVLCALAAAAVADIPAHCVRNQVLGEWTLSLSPKVASFAETQGACDAAGPASTPLQVTLKNPDVAVTADGQTGFWTLVYDQGIELVLGSRKFFWYFAYTQEGSKVTSFCGKSLAQGASYHNTPAIGEAPTGWGCMTAVHKDSSSLVSTHEHRPSLLNTPEGLSAYQEDKGIVEHINEAQSSWKAEPNPNFVGKSIKQLQAMAGARPVFREGVAAVPRIAQEAGVDAAPGLPRNWDWRNTSAGANYVEPMRDQLTCGSCYAFGTTSMLDERTRILTGDNDEAFFSPQDIVSCNPYSQGCDGGFPYLVSKFGEDFGIATEQCFPYESGILPNVSCSARCHDQSQYLWVTDYHYVGGFYGGCSEAAMRQEIFDHGPVAVGFEVYPDLMNYKSGVYHHVQSSDELSVNPWEETNHAVVVVGWGVEDSTNEKYWIVKNSWGRHFGDGGYFNIRRGTDECGIESMAVAATPVLRG